MRTTSASWRGIICTPLTQFEAATATLIRARRWLGGTFTFLRRVCAAQFVRRRLYSIAAASSVIAVAVSARGASREQSCAAATSAFRRCVFSHSPRPTSQQPQLHLSSWSLFTDFIGVGNVYGRGQLRMLRSSPAGLASLSPYLLLHLSSCFLCQVARSSVDIFTAYAQSMPAGIAAVIGANGALFKY
jgi:hypothetical protein